jgi:hypothetical protein
MYASSRVVSRGPEIGSHFESDSEDLARSENFRKAGLSALDVRYWHDSDIQECPPNVGYRGQSGQHFLNLSLTGFDPKRN